MNPRNVLCLAVPILVAASPLACAGPLSLLLPDDARAFGFDERLGTHFAAARDARLLAAHPATLGRFEELPWTLEARSVREWTYRRTRRVPSETTRVDSSGAAFSLLGALRRSPWRFAATYGPSESEGYEQSRANARANGDFGTLVLALGRPLGRGQTLGVALSHASVGLPIEVKALNLGSLLPGVSRYDGRFRETRLSAEWERGHSTANALRLRAGVLVTSAGLGVTSPASGRSASFSLDTLGHELGARWTHRTRSGTEWTLEGSGEARSDGAPLRLDDGTRLGEGAGSYRTSSFSLYRRSYHGRVARAMGVETLGGNGQIAVGSNLGPLFPSNPLGVFGRANARATVGYRATLFRVGEVRQLSGRWQLRTGLAFGKVGASLRADSLAFAVLPLAGVGSNYRGRLGPRFGFIPSLGLAYSTGRARIVGQVSQFVPLPQSLHGSGGSSSPTPGRTSARTFGGTLGSIALQWRF